KKYNMPKKNHHLQKEFYIGEKTVSFVLCISNRDEVFTDIEIFKIFSQFLIDSIIKHDTDALIYMFMPDHVHMILKGKEMTSNVISSINLFKQLSGYWLYKNKMKYSWQKDYWDHIIRNEKDLENQIYYILNNPVRKGLANNWKEYMFF